MSFTPRFSMNDFSNWFANQNGVEDFFQIQKTSLNPLDKFVGGIAHPKVSKNKLLETVVSSHDKEEVICEFKRNGGVIVDTNQKNLCIKLENGMDFEMPRFCVKVTKS